MLARPKSANAEQKDGTSYMSDSQLADYLADLRNDRVARLTGTRPAPPSRYQSQRKTAAVIPAASQDSSLHVGRPLIPEPLRLRPQPPPKEINSAHVVGNLSTSPSVIYLEDPSRHAEKQEAHSLRMAMQGLDLNEEQRIYDAAQSEASALVLEHTTIKRSKELGYTNPDMSIKDRTIHLQQGTSGDSPAVPVRSAKRAIHNVRFADQPVDDPPPVLTSPKKKGYHGLANAVANDIANIKRRVSSGGTRIVSGGRRKASHDKHSFPNPDDKIYEEPDTVMEQPEEAVRFVPPQEPQPQPEEMPSVADLPRHLRKNPFARVRLNRDNLERANSLASNRSAKFDPIEIQRNPPTQSRRPWYMSNKPSLAPAAETTQSQDPVRKDEALPEAKDGKEIRGDDIRAATSMKRKDRSPNLPQPTAVSDTPGRPIVSFQHGWQKSEKKRESREPLPVPPKSPDRAVAARVAETRNSMPQTTQPVSRPSEPSKYGQQQDQRNMARPTTGVPNGIPILNLPDDDDGSWSRVLAEEPDIAQADPLQTGNKRPRLAPAASPKPPTSPIPSINVDEMPEDRPVARPLPTPHRAPAHAKDPPAPMPKSHGSLRQPHVTPMQKRNAVLCAQCALPISGRILTAAGERFHPECFTCHQCNINLECVAFYPEPDKKYYERLARIQQRMQGFDIMMPEGATEEDMYRLEQEDGDESMRFFCHLDFHELFSPRCRSCKTPIEGEVVVACGAEWHVGHFFCAQCGDPFDSSTPFVEKDGYAWCLGCHTNRYSPKCKKCRKPVTDVVVNAIGHDWHAECFCCVECGGDFSDGQFFLRGDSTDPVCIRCEDRRLKA